MILLRDRPVLAATVAVAGAVAFDELVEIAPLDGVLLDGVVDVGAVIVDPQLSSPRGFPGFLAAEEDPASRPR
jgi:hypothetical protein